MESEAVWKAAGGIVELSLLKTVLRDESKNVKMKWHVLIASGASKAAHNRTNSSST